MTLTLGKKKCREGLNVCMNYEFNLLHHVGVVAKRVCAAAVAAAETAAAAHEGDNNTPSGPTGQGVKTMAMCEKYYKTCKLITAGNIIAHNHDKTQFVFRKECYTSELVMSSHRYRKCILCIII